MNEHAAKRAAFRALHQSGCFVMPNPWDRGSAVHLESFGFPALATTSAGHAFTRGLPDNVGALDRDQVLAHVAEIVDATRLPVNADFQDGYGSDVEESVRLCIATGVAGLSIEDATGDPSKPLYDLDVAVERVRAARRAIDRSGCDVLLTGRAECYLYGHPQAREESLRRLRAFADAGADVLFAPGVPDAEGMRAMVEAVAPKPINVLIGWQADLRVSDLAALGVRRVSVGSALARVGWTAFEAAAKSIAEQGDFSGFKGLLSTTAISEWFESR